MHSRHAVPPAEDQGCRTADRGVTRDSKATGEERNVTAFSSAPVEKEKRDRRYSLELTAERGMLLALWSRTWRQISYFCLFKIKGVQTFNSLHSTHMDANVVKNLLHSNKTKLEIIKI